MNLDSPLERAKARLLIPDIWERLGLPGAPATSCCSPFRQDQHASFSVFENGRRWKDFGTGQGGDAVDFVATALHLDDAAAAHHLMEMAGTTRSVRLPTTRPSLLLPALTSGTAEQHRQLAALRGLAVEGVGLAADRGLLRFGPWKGRSAWFVLDRSHRNAQARRMDGEKWSEIGGKKAYTLPGSQAAWPLGIREAEGFPAIALVEGGPDLLAAFHFCWCEDRETDCAPVAMLGAGLSIHAEALPLFSSRRVRIFAHDDSAGQKALGHWARQLRSVGAAIDAFRISGLRRLNGEPAKDLNDLTEVHPDDFERERALWALLP